jgi:selenocysteine lyase/cysteine desulfurase
MPERTIASPPKRADARPVEAPRGSRERRAHAAWQRPAGHYLNTASYGLPTRDAAQATLRWIREWEAGSVPFSRWLSATDRARALFAQLVGADADHVATGTSVAQLFGLVAASVPDGALVLSSDDEFASLLHPFLAQADRGVRVETLPSPRLLEAAADRGDVVIFSLVRSQDGFRADDLGLVSAVPARGALTVVDAAQAIGWLDTDYRRFDIVVAPAFKWLCSPRGTAFMLVRPEHLAWLRPSAAGWWPSTAERSPFGGPLQLPPTAKRLDATPAWTSWAGTAASLEVVSRRGSHEIGGHVLALAGRLCDGLGLPPGDTAIVMLADPALKLIEGARRTLTTWREGICGYAKLAWNALRIDSIGT